MSNGTKPKTGGGKSSASVPDGKKSQQTLIIAIIIILLLILAAAGGGLYFFFTKLGIWKGNFGFDKKTAVEKPVGIPEMAVTQRIPAAEGGTIKATLPSGYTATLTIPKGALKKDTDITLTPFAPVGSNGGNQNPPGQNPPGGNNPDGNNPPGGNGDDNNPPPDNGDDNNPPPGGSDDDNPPGNPPDDSSSDDNGGLPPIINPFGDRIGGVIITPDDLIFGIPAIISFDPFGSNTAVGPGVATGGPGTGTVVHTGPSGTSTIIPGSGSGGSAGGPIGGGGTVSGDPPTQDEAERIAEGTAQASGGTCTPEFISAIKAMANIPGYPAGSIMARTLDDCLSLEWLREKCQNDPIALRRLYFEERLRIAAALRAPKEKVDEINRLLNDCVARYEISASGSYPGMESMMSGTADLWVCGYLDDPWQGTMRYQMVPPGLPGAGHYFSGTIDSMKLPPRGGPFWAEAIPDGHFGGAGLVDLSGIPLGLEGSFDGQSTLTSLLIYTAQADNVPINITEERPCVPLAPLGN